MRKLLLAALVAASPLAAQDAADLVVTNARVYTVDQTHPIAHAFAVRDGRFVFVGSDMGAMALAGNNTEVIDAGGRTIIPGMIDAHGHLANLGSALRNLDLVGTTSYQQIVEMVAARVRDVDDGEWITGRGWDQNDWANQEFPTNHELNRVAPDNPVVLTRVDGHAILANEAAIRAAGITDGTPDPDGGRIVRDEDGRATGVFVDNAADSVSARIPDPSHEERRTRILTAIRHLNSFGLTGLHDAGVSDTTIEVYRELAQEGNYDLRNYVMVSTGTSTLESAFQRGPETDLYGGRLWLRAIKISSDGALGSRGAAMIEDYSDDAGNKGLITFGYDSIVRIVSRALETGFQVNVHAIGDRANRRVLDAFEAALAEHPLADHRFRVEHAQILDYHDLPRFAQLGVIPSMQGSHQTSDMYWAINRIGPARILGAYAWRSLLNTGVIIPNGSDFPVESANPLISFHSFVSRHDADRWPAGGWYPGQRTTRDEALLSVTLWPAYASFMEDNVGSITAGKYADFVILDRDIMTVDEHEILDTKVEETYLGGELVFSRE